MNHAILRGFGIVLTFVISCGCARRHPVIQNWRLLKQAGGQRLIPPDVPTPNIVVRSLKTDVKRGKGPCPPSDSVVELKTRGGHFHAKVTGEGLANQATGWLGQWADRLEEHGCVAPGGGIKLAGRIAESVPLDPRDAFRLLYADDKETGEVDLNPLIRLQVVSPLWRKEGLGLMADGPYSVTAGRGYNLTITGKSTENLKGYETAFYAVSPSPGGVGSKIIAIYADRNLEGKIERLPTPSTNYFPLSPDAAFFRLFYKSGQNDFTAILIAARTPAELNERTRAMKVSTLSAPCADVAAGMCLAIPKAVAVNPLIAVTVNQSEILLPRGATLQQALRRAGHPRPNEIPTALAVLKPWNGRLAPVDFDHSDPGVLRLVLGGGEVISWR